MNKEYATQNSGPYRPNYEHDTCGVGLVVNINGNKYHSVVEQGLCVLEHMAHCGAEGADNKTGDGAGILVQIFHELILLNGIPIPEKGRYGVGMVFLPRNDEDKRNFMRRFVVEAMSFGAISREVHEMIAPTRHSIPSITLISPRPTTTSTRSMTSPS